MKSHWYFNEKTLGGNPQHDKSNLPSTLCSQQLAFSSGPGQMDRGLGTGWKSTDGALQHNQLSYVEYVFFLRSSIDLDQLSNHSYTFVPKKYQHSGLRYAWRRTLWQTMNWWGRFSSLSIMRTTVLGRRGSHPLVTFKFLAIAYRHTGPGTCSRIYELMTM